MKKILVLFVGFALVLGGCFRSATDLNSILVGLFADKYEIPVSEIEVSIDGSTSHHASGMVRLGEGPGNAGGFLASDMLGEWEIVWDGNGVYLCSEVEPYGFPSAFIEGCYDEDEGDDKADTDGDEKKDDGANMDNILGSIMKSLFVQESGFEDLTVEDLEITFSEIQNNHIKGMVEVDGGGPGNAGGFLASNINGDWELVWHGNGVYECSVLENYSFPENMKEGCFESVVDEIVFNEGMEDILKQRFAEKYNKNVSDVELSINEEEPSFAKGLVKFSGEIAGAMFFAAEIGGEWVIVWDGNGTYECSLLNDYYFPEDWKEGCI